MLLQDEAIKQIYRDPSQVLIARLPNGQAGAQIPCAGPTRFGRMTGARIWSRPCPPAHRHVDLGVEVRQQSDRYDAFISYSHAPDLLLAEALQSELERFARPWYQSKRIRVFRDTTSLAAAPGLWSVIESALQRSTWFVLMASPASAQSAWVQKEVEWWKAHRTVEHMLITLTAGSIRWVGDDFSWDDTDALPRALSGVFEEEPLWIDLRKLRPAAGAPERLAERPGLGDIVAEFAAPILGQDKDALVGEHVRRQRRIRQVTRGVVAALSGLLLLTSVAAIVAFNQKSEADRQRRVAVNQAQIATSRLLLAQADTARQRDPRTALLLGIAARNLNDDGQTRAGLVRTLTGTRYAGSVIGHEDSVNSAAFAVDGQMLATASSDGTAMLWDVTRRGRPVSLGPPLVVDRSDKLHPPLRFVVFAGSQIVILGDVDGAVTIWDIANPGKPAQLSRWATRHTDNVTAAVLSPDRRTLVTGSADNSVMLWDVSDPTRPSRLGRPVPVNEGYVQSLAFSPDGRTLATGNTGGTVALYDVTSPAAPIRIGHPFQADFGPPTSIPDVPVAFAGNGRTLATGGSDGTIQLWDVTNRAKPTKLGEPGIGFHDAVRAIAFSPDGHTLGSAGQNDSILLWDVQDRSRPVKLGPPLAEHTSSVNAVVFAPDGRTLASASVDRTVTLWDVTGHGTPVRMADPPEPAGALGMAFTPDGRMYAIGNDDNSTVSLWSIVNRGARRHLRDLTGHDDAVLSVAFSPDGRLMATGGSDSKILLWSMADPSAPTRLGGPITTADSVWSVAFSPDGRTLAGGLQDGTVPLWDVADPTRVRRLGQPLNADLGGVRSVTFAASGRTMAVGHWDGVALWNVIDRLHPQRLGKPLTGHHGWGSVTSVAFTGDETAIAASGDDGSVLLWDVINPSSPRRLGQPLPGHGVSTLSVAFTPDNRVLAAGDRNGNLTLWDAEDLSRPVPLGNPLAASALIWTVAFTSDGKTLAASTEENADLWDLSVLAELLSDPSKPACDATGRGMNKEEWRSFTAGIPFRSTCPA